MLDFQIRITASPPHKFYHTESIAHLDFAIPAEVLEDFDSVLAQRYIGVTVHSKLLALCEFYAEHESWLDLVEVP